MATIKQLVPSASELLDEEALIREAHVLSRRRRRRRGLLVITLFAVACLVAVGVDRFSSLPAPSSNNDASSAATLTCPSARVKLLGVTALSGGLGHGGVLVRASVSSAVACTMSGYPTVGAGLSSHSTATATDVRNAYLGGLTTKASAPLPRLLITSRARCVLHDPMDHWQRANMPIGQGDPNHVAGFAGGPDRTVDVRGRNW